MQFEFATAGEIRFGAGACRQVPERVRQAGTSVLLVTGGRGRDGGLGESLRARGFAVAIWSVSREPTLDDAREATTAASRAGCDIVVSVGGGSAIDLGKAVAALLANPGDPLDYVEVIGRGQPLTRRSAPFVAVPTTAGTGAEVTRNAVLASPSDGVKVSLRSPLMLPTLAVVDPELTSDLPPSLTASTGMDALTQLIEPYLSVRATPLVDAICRDGIPRAARALPRATRRGEDRDARTDMSLASLYGGLALANAGLGIVHGCAAAIGGRFPAPHGAVCAALLPGALRVNLRVARATGAVHVVARVAEISQWLGGSGDAPEEGPGQLERLRIDLQVPGLRTYGVSARDVEGLALAAARASSTRGNPVPLSIDDISAVLEAGL